MFIEIFSKKQVFSYRVESWISLNNFIFRVKLVNLSSSGVRKPLQITTSKFAQNIDTGAAMAICATNISDRWYNNGLAYWIYHTVNAGACKSPTFPRVHAENTFNMRQEFQGCTGGDSIDASKVIKLFKGQ